MIDRQEHRERIRVAPGDTLDSVLERVRTSVAGEVVLDVDERSHLLISLQHLHALDETAQERGLAVSIASTNSKLLNAARIFGLPISDPRAATPPAHPGREQPASLPFVVEREAAPVEDEGRGVRGAEWAAVAALDTEDGEEDGAWVAPEPDGDADWSEADPAGYGGRALQAVAAPSAGDSARERDPNLSAPPPGARLDPYGQPYDDEDDEGGGDEAPPFARAPRVIRPPGRERAWAPAPAVVEEEGWDDEIEDDADEDREAARSPRWEPRRAFDGLAVRWAGARAWLDERRATLTGSEVDEADDLDDEAAWDDEVGATPPPRPAAPHDGGEGDENVGAEDSPPAPSPRVIRPLGPLLARRPVAPAAGRSRAPVAEPEEFDEPEDEGEARDWEDDPEPGVARGREWDESRTRRAGAFGAFLLALAGLATLLLLAGGLYLFLARATVTLVTRTGSVATEFQVVVGEIDPASPQGQPTQQQIVAPAKRLIVPVAATASRPATGSRLEPDVTAGGPVVLTNPSVEAVTVPRGTTLTATDGRTYTTLEGVTVAAADPYNTGAFGTATVRVAASVKGSAGNVDSGVVRGQLPSGVYYNNRNAPIAGGSDRRVPVLTRQDLLAAQAAAETAARAKGQDALAAALPPGSVIMGGTAGAGKFTVELSAREGSDGDAVTATVAGEATALTYAPAEIEARARAEAERRLVAAAAAGETVVPGSVQLVAPQLVEETPGLLRYRMSGTAGTRAAAAGDQERARLAERLAGKGDEEARAILQTVPGLSSYAIDYAPSWFPDRMPLRASRIDIRLADPR